MARLTRRMLRPSAAYAWDSFTRADDTAALGLCESGQTWLAPIGGPWGITSNAGFLNVAGSTKSVAVVPTMSSNGFISCLVTRAQSRGGVVIRSDAEGRGLFIFGDGASLIIFDDPIGATVASTSFAWGSGARTLWVAFHGPRLVAGVDSTALLSANYSQYLSRTYHGLYGLQASATVNRWSTFRFAAIGEMTTLQP